MDIFIYRATAIFYDFDPTVRPRPSQLYSWQTVMAMFPLPRIGNDPSYFSYKKYTLDSFIIRAAISMKVLALWMSQDLHKNDHSTIVC